MSPTPDVSVNEKAHLLFSPMHSFFFLLEYNCFTMSCQFLLYNEVNQLYVYRHSPALDLPPPPIPPIEVITEHRAELPVLYSRFPLAIYFTYGSVFMSDLISHFIPPYPSPLCPHVRSLRLWLYSCPANRFIEMSTCALLIALSFSNSTQFSQGNYSSPIACSLRALPTPDSHLTSQTISWEPESGNPRAESRQGWLILAAMPRS